MRTGVLGVTHRSMTPSASSSFSRSESIRSLRPGIACFTSLNRVSPVSIARTIAPVQRLPMSSIARL